MSDKQPSAGAQMDRIIADLLRIRCASIEEAAKLRHAVDDLKDEHTGCAEMVEALRLADRYLQSEPMDRPAVPLVSVRKIVHSVLAKHEGKG
jgi:hypothetical protein